MSDINMKKVAKTNASFNKNQLKSVGGGQKCGCIYKAENKIIGCVTKGDNSKCGCIFKSDANDAVVRGVVKTGVVGCVWKEEAQAIEIKATKKIK